MPPMRPRLLLVLPAAALVATGCLVSLGITNSPSLPGESRPLP